MANTSKELNFKFYFVFINLNLNSYMWLVATILNKAVLDPNRFFFLSGQIVLTVLCQEIDSEEGKHPFLTHFMSYHNILNKIFFPLTIIVHLSPCQ